MLGRGARKSHQEGDANPQDLRAAPLSRRPLPCSSTQLLLHICHSAMERKLSEVIVDSAADALYQLMYVKINNTNSVTRLGSDYQDAS